MNRKPIVSICCFTFNQENYVKDALDGFLMQKTEFPFEIIIHDDASTDKTADIIQDYQKRYPGKITAICQNSNQYSKGILPEIYVYKIIQGKYVAFCEGDDYWTDPLKLQKQVSEMEKYPDCHISFHPAIGIFPDGKKRKILSRYSRKNKIVSIDDVILGGGLYMPTAAVIVHSSVIPRVLSFFDFAKPFPIGDYFLQILGAENGGALYLNEAMCAYRINAKNSFSLKLKDSRFTSKIKILCINVLEKIDEFTEYRFSKTIKEKKSRTVSGLIISFQYDFETRNHIFTIYKDTICLRDKILWNLLFKRPSLVNFLRNIKNYFIEF
jgi:glycosyltransferase involved in cell wall biosynthesis